MERSVSAPNGSVIRFEIPAFGVAKFRPEVFTKLQEENDHKSIYDLVVEITDMGFMLDVMRDDVKDLSLIEWLAIYGECTGNGMD
jgi:hypothetical protein